MSVEHSKTISRRRAFYFGAATLALLIENNILPDESRASRRTQEENLASTVAALALMVTSLTFFRLGIKKPQKSLPADRTTADRKFITYRTDWNPFSRN